MNDTRDMSVDQKNILDKLDKHLLVMTGLAPSSVQSYRRHIAEFLSWREGNALDGPVTRQDIEGFLGWCFRRGNSNATRQTKIIALQNYFRFLIYSGMQTDDPTASLPRMRVTKPLMQTFNQDEILRMFAVCDISREKGLRDLVFLILGVFAGFRVSEIVGLKIEEISDDGKEMDLVIPKTKRGAGRVVYLWKAPAMFIRQLLVMRIAAGARTGDPLLVGYYKGGRPRGNRRLSTKALDTLIKTLAQRAGLRKVAIKTHMLRASHANSLQHVRGYTLPAIMERMGWKDLSTATRYLVRRERILRECCSLHEFWIDFTRVWTKEDPAADSRQAE